jgi:glycosyltransferase involved in cell wall biosynthesis
VVTTVHDVVFRAHPELVEPRLRAYLDRATARACKGADAIVTVSQFSKKELERFYSVPAERVRVIYNGAHRPREEALSQDPIAELEAVGLQPSGFFLYVGRIEAKKNIEVLLQAFREVTKALPGHSIKLALAGSLGDSDYPLQERLGTLGLKVRVAALGYVPNTVLESLYANALAFVYPSLYEGFGLPPLEAMARGVPTVVSDGSSLPEVVGKDALLFNPLSPKELSLVLLDLIRNEHLRQDLSRRGRRRAEEFTWRRSAQEHLEVYHLILNCHEITPSRV